MLDIRYMVVSQNNVARMRYRERNVFVDLSEDANTIENQSQDLETARASRPTFFSYAHIFIIALLKDLLDLTGIGSLPGIGTVVTFCFALLIFLLLLFAKTNRKLIDSRFVLRMGIILLLGSMTEGFAFGLNFLPIETLTIFIIYFMDRNLSDKQIETITAALQVLHKKGGQRQRRLTRRQ